MIVDGTREQLAAIARAEFASWKEHPLPRRPPAQRPSRSGLLDDLPARPCGEGPADPRVLTELVEALTLHVVQGGGHSGEGAKPQRVPRVLIEQLLARGDISDERIARVAGVTTADVEDVRAQMDELAAS